MHFCERLVPKNRGFQENFTGTIKITSHTMGKLKTKTWKSQRIVEQRKVLTSNTNEYSGVFSLDAIVNSIA